MTTLLSLVEALARDPEEKAAYAAAPDAYLERHGFGELTPAEVNEAVAHSADTLPPPVAAQLQPGEGLNSVAAVDPEAFDPTVPQQYEDDLFGQDDALDPDDPALHGFEDGGADGGFEDLPTVETPEGAGHDGAQALAAGGEDGSADEADGGVDGSAEDGAAAEGGAAGTRGPLGELSDPHGLDADEPADPTAPVALAAEPSEDTTAPEERVADLAEEPGGAGTVPAELGSGAGGIDDAFSGPLRDAPPVADPFDGDPLGGAEEPWYQQSPDESFDVEIDEPDSDILDDVDDLHFDD